MLLRIFSRAGMAADPSPTGRRGDGPRDLRDDDAFRRLASQVHEHQTLDRRLREALPESLRSRVRLAGVKNGCLVFLVPSPAWAARLRTLQVPILAAAHHAGVDAHGITTRVVPLESTPEPEPARGEPLSAAAAEHLRRTARTLSDAGLREAFLKLAATADTPASPRHET